MIRDRETLESIFTIVKAIKKPIVAIYPDGRMIGTDEQFASLNILMCEAVRYNISIPYIFITKELNSFMREIKNHNDIIYSPYDIVNSLDKSIYVINHLELNFQIEQLYNRTILTQAYPLLYKEENFQNIIPDMFSLKVSDGARMYSLGVNTQFLMSSFNSIHPATKSDRVDLIIRDNDQYSYIAEFIIYKKKDKCELHEFLRFRKL